MQIFGYMAVACLRAVYFFFKLVLKPRRKITFLSRQSNAVPVDFALLKDALKEDGFTGEVKVLCKKIAPGITGKTAYAFHIFTQMYHIATSSVVVIDGYSIAVSVLNHKSGQKFVQIWHAINIVKKFGYQALDKPWGHKSSTAKVFCMHKNYTHIIAGSEKSAYILKECFNTSAKAVILPLPRVDYILKAPEKRDEIGKVYPNIFEKPILLYAPTFRVEKVNLSWISNAVDLEKYNVVVKLHPEDKYGFDNAVDKRVILDTWFPCFDWMKVCDSLVTDYSGTGFEAMLLEKKVYYYLYDYEVYSLDNGLNLDLFSEDISPVVTKTADGLREILAREYDFALTRKYVEKYLSAGTENCAVRLADFIKGLV